MVAKARRGSVDLSTLQNARSAVDHLGRPLQQVDHLGRPIKASKKQKREMMAVQPAATAAATPVEPVASGPCDGFCAVLKIMSEFVGTAFDAVRAGPKILCDLSLSCAALSVFAYVATAAHTAVALSSLPILFEPCVRTFWVRSVCVCVVCVWLLMWMLVACTTSLTVIACCDCSCRGYSCTSSSSSGFQFGSRATIFLASSMPPPPCLQWHRRNRLHLQAHPPL